MADASRFRRISPPLFAALLAAGTVQAQIVTNGSVVPEVSLSGGQTATFTGPGMIKTALLPPAVTLAEGPAIALLEHFPTRLDRQNRTPI